MPGGAGTERSRNPNSDNNNSGQSKQQLPAGKFDGSEGDFLRQELPKPSNTRVELPGIFTQDTFSGSEGQFKSVLPARPGYNTSGKQVQIRVNQYKITAAPNKDVHQYDINISDSDGKLGKIMAVWKSKAVQNAILGFKAPLLWDGNKLAWSSANIPVIRITVNLDEEKGRAPRPGKMQDIVQVAITHTKIIRLAVIDAFIQRKIPFDTTVYEAINFLDHLMRQGPSEQYITFKRSFFSKNLQGVALDNVITAVKGVYSSIRLCDPRSLLSNAVGTGLAVNVDVANGTFWTAQPLHQAVRNLCKSRNRQLSYDVLANQLAPVPYKEGWTTSEDFKELRRMHKLKFKVKFFLKTDAYAGNKIHTIKKFTFDTKLGKQGSNAKTTTFELRDRNTGKVETISVYNHFKRRYGVDLQYWQLPLVTTERDGTFPMEACTLVPYQRYVLKLSPDQTSNMIKFAVTRPKERMTAIQDGVNMLAWHKDRYLNHFGLKMDPNMTITPARVLQNPEIAFANQKVNPGTSGRWDLRGKKFLLPNPQPLVSWGVCIIQQAVDEATCKNFINEFVKAYIGHGGNVKNRNPAIYNQPRNEDLADTARLARSLAGNQSNALPQIMLFILPGRDSFMYERLKRCMECRFGTVSQMLNQAHVRKAQPQYCSNVCMKLNAKLGGTTCKNYQAKPFPVPTMFIGADVSHASPGSQQPSTAAITMSFDDTACRYAANVQTNGHRVEMISEENIRNGFMELFNYWVSKFGRGPQHIYYFRDGVSEGQYQHVLDQEVALMKTAILEKYNRAKDMRWTVTVCSKRHHIRFFPKEGDTQAGDKFSNPLPGTLVERDVVHPFEYDFYLNSHSAIQGTARPVHYHVIMDEAKLNPNDFQSMIYKHCYQYMRSTTPVSLHPAVYYAHLASNRARCHESTPASQGPSGGQKFVEAQQDAVIRQAVAPSRVGGSSHTSEIPSEARPLVPLAQTVNDENVKRAVKTGMWYI